MEIVFVVLVLHVVAVALLVVGRALHSRLGPLQFQVAERGSGAALASGGPSELPSDRTFEEYVRSGLVDLRIMLAQAARRGDT